MFEGKTEYLWVMKMNMLKLRERLKEFKRQQTFSTLRQVAATTI